MSCPSATRVGLEDICKSCHSGHEAGQLAHFEMVGVAARIREVVGSNVLTASVHLPVTIAQRVPGRAVLLTPKPTDGFQSRRYCSLSWVYSVSLCHCWNSTTVSSLVLTHHLSTNVVQLLLHILEVMGSNLYLLPPWLT
jgi:hypothetical protein